MILKLVFMILLLAPVLGVLSFFDVDYIDPKISFEIKLLIPIFAISLCLFEGIREIINLSSVNLDTNEEDKLY